MARFAPARRMPLSFAARACREWSQCTARRLRGTRAVRRRAEPVRALCALRAFVTAHRMLCTWPDAHTRVIVMARDDFLQTSSPSFQKSCQRLANRGPKTCRQHASQAARRPCRRSRRSPWTSPSTPSAPSEAMLDTPFEGRHHRISPEPGKATAWGTGREVNQVAAGASRHPTACRAPAYGRALLCTRGGRRLSR